MAPKRNKHTSCNYTCSPCSILFSSKTLHFYLNGHAQNEVYLKLGPHLIWYWNYTYLFLISIFFQERLEWTYWRIMAFLRLISKYEYYMECFEHDKIVLSCHSLDTYCFFFHSVISVIVFLFCFWPRYPVDRKNQIQPAAGESRFKYSIPFFSMSYNI